MKIYILPITQKFKPATQLFKYPKHNADYGVEQDFYKYLMEKNHLIIDSPSNADWHYLPIFWTRWHLNHSYAQEGLDELQAAVNHVMIDDSKTFSICQYDDGPLVDLGKTTLFLASRKTEEGIDIPLLSSKHRYWFPRRKRYLASFVGRLSTHHYRGEMAENLNGYKNVLINDGDKGTKYFVNKALASYIVLAPRGYGGSSFRFFEAMQLGVVPFLIGDLDTRPFRKWINWDEFSFFTNDSTAVKKILMNTDPKKLKEMGEKAKECYYTHLTYQKWCKYVLKELGELIHE